MRLPWVVPPVPPAAGGVAGFPRSAWPRTVELGSETADPLFAPALIPDISGATSWAAGAEQTCALLPEAGIVCWGSNEYGQLGEGRSPRTVAPVLTLEF